jgi:hypothetical protein
MALCLIYLYIVVDYIKEIFICYICTIEERAKKTRYYIVET